MGNFAVFSHHRHEAVSYARRRVNETIEVGLATRHRSDGTPRLICAIHVHQQPIACHDMSVRLGNVELLVVRGASCLQRPLLTIGIERWRSHARSSAPSDFLNIAKDPTRERLENYELTNGILANVCTLWRVEFAWPIVRGWERAAPPGRVPIQLPIRGCTGGFAYCAGANAYITCGPGGSFANGEIIVDDARRMTYFFPGDVSWKTS